MPDASPPTEGGGIEVRPGPLRSRTAVLVFLALAFGISWIAYYLRPLAGDDTTVRRALQLLVKFGPSLAGIITTMIFVGGTGVRSLLSRLLPHSLKPRWMIFAIAFPVSLVLMAAVIRNPSGLFVDRDLPFWTQWMGLALNLWLLRVFLGGGLGEELGWRGFLLSHLLTTRGPLQASVIIGLLHALWHFPAMGAAVIPFALLTVAGSIVMTWMFARTNHNLLLPVLMHGSMNASVPALVALVPEFRGDVAWMLIITILWCLFAGWVGRSLGPAENDASGDIGTGQLPS